VTQSESLRHDESGKGRGGGHPDSPCFMVRRDDSSQYVTEKRVECNHHSPPSGTATWQQVPATCDDALRLALRLAVDVGEYDRAAAILDVLRRTVLRGSVPRIPSMREPT
jgi:hypothetical protein